MAAALKKKKNETDEYFTKEEKKAATKQAKLIMMGRWVEVDQDIASEMKKMLPNNIEKNVAYDVIKLPMKYLESNLTMSRLVGMGVGKNFEFKKD